MKTVVTEFLENIGENKGTAGNPDGQACDIDKGIPLVFQMTSEGGFKVIFYHYNSHLSKTLNVGCTSI